MRQNTLLIVVFAFFVGCNPDNKTTMLNPPFINEVWPVENPADWAVIIKGTNLKDVTKVTFGDKPAVIDTTMSGIVTTRVPVGLPAGPVNLIIENSGGQSNTFQYTILAAAPIGPPSPKKAVVGRKAKYLPKLPDGGTSTVGWQNQYGTNHSIKFSFSGNIEFWGTDEFPFEVLHYPKDEDKTIKIEIDRNGIKEIYEGEYIEMDNTSSTQRILFYNEKKRQIVVVSN